MPGQSGGNGAINHIYTSAAGGGGGGGGAPGERGVRAAPGLGDLWPSHTQVRWPVHDSTPEHAPSVLRGMTG